MVELVRMEGSGRRCRIQFSSLPPKSSSHPWERVNPASAAKCSGKGKVRQAGAWAGQAGKMFLGKERWGGAGVAGKGQYQYPRTAGRQAGGGEGFQILQSRQRQVRQVGWQVAGGGGVGKEM